MLGCTAVRLWIKRSRVGIPLVLGCVLNTPIRLQHQKPRIAMNWKFLGLVGET